MQIVHIFFKRWKLSKKKDGTMGNFKYDTILILFELISYPDLS